jgi:hypothetical protein
VSGHLQVKAALPPEEEPPAPTGQGAGWAPEPVLPWRREESLPVPGNESWYFERGAGMGSKLLIRDDKRRGVTRLVQPSSLCAFPKFGKAPAWARKEAVWLLDGVRRTTVCQPLRQLQIKIASATDRADRVTGYSARNLPSGCSLTLLDPQCCYVLSAATKHGARGQMALPRIL